MEEGILYSTVELWNNLAIVFCGLREQHQSQKHHSTSFLCCIWLTTAVPLPSGRAELGLTHPYLFLEQHPFLLGPLSRGHHEACDSDQDTGKWGEGSTAMSNSYFCFFQTKILCSREAEVGVKNTLCAVHLCLTPIFTSMYKYATFMVKVICWLPLIEPKCYVWYF